MCLLCVWCCWCCYCVRCYENTLAPSTSAPMRGARSCVGACTQIGLANMLRIFRKIGGRALLRSKQIMSEGRMRDFELRGIVWRKLYMEFERIITQAIFVCHKVGLNMMSAYLRLSDESRVFCERAPYLCASLTYLCACVCASTHSGVL